MEEERINIGNPDKLAKTIQSYMEDFGRDVTEAIGEAMDEVGKEAVNRLKSTSPKKKKNGGRYAKGWKYQRDKKSRLLIEARVYNATDGSLTHLLEKGHPIIRNGVVVGRVKPQKHIEPVDQWVEQNFARIFAQKLK
jgi:hypothetical protein